MVVHGKPAKTSSFQIQLPVLCEWYLPDTIAIVAPEDSDSYTVVGEFGPKRVDVSRWRKPHADFANLPLSPPFVLRFLKHHGVLKGVTSEDLAAIEKTLGSSLSRGVLKSPRRVQARSEELQGLQGMLQRAWRGDVDALKQIQEEVTARDSFRSTQSILLSLDQSGGLELVVRNLWIFLCILFLRDFGQHKTGICENPDCPVPYFIKKRRTQKICEAGDCVQWAQRKYALNWWRRKEKATDKQKGRKTQ